MLTRKAVVSIMLVVTIAVGALVGGCGKDNKTYSMDQVLAMQDEAKSTEGTPDESKFDQFFFRAGSPMVVTAFHGLDIRRVGEDYYYSKDEGFKEYKKMSAKDSAKLLEIIDKYDLKSWEDPEDAGIILDGETYDFWFYMSDKSLIHAEGMGWYQMHFLDMMQDMDKLFKLGYYES